MRFLENWRIPSDATWLTNCYFWVSTEGTQICGNYWDNGLTGHPLYLASFLSHNFTPVIMPEMQYNKLTMWYFILLYFSASDLLIGLQQAWCHHRFFGSKILRVYCWEKNQPAKFDKTDYQTIPIILYFTLFWFIYFMATQKRLPPDPVVGLGARPHLCMFRFHWQCET